MLFRSVFSYSVAVIQRLLPDLSWFHLQTIVLVCNTNLRLYSSVCLLLHTKNIFNGCHHVILQQFCKSLFQHHFFHLIKDKEQRHNVMLLGRVTGFLDICLASLNDRFNADIVSPQQGGLRDAIRSLWAKRISFHYYFKC